MTNALPIDVNAVIDEGRWTPYQRWLVCLTALTIVFDGVDNQLLGITIPQIMSAFGVARSAFAPVVAFGFLGMAVGGAIAGLAGDRAGRRTALLGSMAIFGVATLGVSTAQSIPALAILRFIVGIGLGGAIPNAAALAAEYVPLNRRPIAVTVTIVCVPLGGTLAGLVAIPLLPSLGWRSLFVVGGILRSSPRSCSDCCCRNRRAIWRTIGRAGTSSHRRSGGWGIPFRRQRPSWNVATRHRTARRSARSSSRRSSRTRWRCGRHSSPACSRSISDSAGCQPSSPRQASDRPPRARAITVFNLGGVAGAIAGGILIARLGSRVTMLALGGGAVVGAAVLSVTPIGPQCRVTRLLVLLGVTGGFINAVQTTMFALAAHVYPTAIRATGVGAAVSVGRSGAILSGYAGPWALEYHGTRRSSCLMATAMASPSSRSHLCDVTCRAGADRRIRPSRLTRRLIPARFIAATVVSSPNRAPSSGLNVAGTRPMGSGLTASRYPVLSSDLKKVTDRSPLRQASTAIVADLFAAVAPSIRDVHRHDSVLAGRENVGRGCAGMMPMPCIRARGRCSVRIPW